MTAMYIMTSKNMNKRVYIDDVIDKISLFVRFQLQNTIYPSYDPVYRFVLICNFFLLIFEKNMRRISCPNKYLGQRRENLSGLKAV